MPTISLIEALSNLTVDDLKSLMRWLPDASRIGKKSVLVEDILRNLVGDRLGALWEGLDETQRLAVAEAMYAEDGCFNAARFRAKYGRLPSFSVRDERRRHEHYGRPTALCLFLYYQNGWRRVPADLKERLMAFVPPPEEPVGRMARKQTIPHNKFLATGESRRRSAVVPWKRSLQSLGSERRHRGHHTRCYILKLPNPTPLPPRRGGHAC